MAILLNLVKSKVCQSCCSHGLNSLDSQSMFRAYLIHRDFVLIRVCASLCSNFMLALFSRDLPPNELH